METDDHQISPSTAGFGSGGRGWGEAGKRRTQVGGHRRTMEADSEGTEVREATRGGGVSVSRCRCGEQKHDPQPLITPP